MSGARRSVTVMQLQNNPASESVVLNPYLKLLTDALPGERITTKWFRWSGLMTDGFDVVHVHWPEFYLRHRTRVGRALKTAMFALFLGRVALTRKAVVRTVHNLRPHEEGPWVERQLLAALDRMTSLWVVMNETTPTPDPARTVLIPHGHYRGWYQSPTNILPVAGQLLAFGRVRAYKGLDELIAAFRELESESMSLEIIGKPEDAETGRAIAKMADGDPRIRLSLRFIPDDELSMAIARCEIVVLPYRDILNSGSALLALSLNRPVVLRDTPSTRLLVREFGDEWVHLFRGDLTSDTLADAVATLRSKARPSEVNMAERDWSLLADRLASAYERAAEHPRR